MDEPLPVAEELAIEDGVRDWPEDGDSEPVDEIVLGVDAEKEDDSVSMLVAEADWVGGCDDELEGVPDDVDALDSDAGADTVAVLVPLEDSSGDGLPLILADTEADCVDAPVPLNVPVGELEREAVGEGLRLGGALMVAVCKPVELRLPVAVPDADLAGVEDEALEAEDVLVAVAEPDVLADALPELNMDEEADVAALTVKLGVELVVREPRALDVPDAVAGPLALAEAAEEPLDVDEGDDEADSEDDPLKNAVSVGDDEAVGEPE